MNQGIDKTDLGRVAVLLGGRAAEREISLISGRAVLEALRRQGVDAHPFDPADGLTGLTADAFTRAFVVLHGRGGEDGVIQGYLDSVGLAYTGSGVAGSALAMDKYRSKLLWRGLGLATPDFIVARDAGGLSAAARLGFPLMVKPAHEGSSIGIRKVDDLAALESAWREAAALDDEVLIEQWIDGAEYTCALLGARALPLIRLETTNPFYDYAAKYQDEDTLYHCPSGLDEATEKAFQELARTAFAALGASGWGRIDLMVDGSGRPWLIEANTVPGMTDHSLVPMAARAAGIDFDELVLRIAASAGHGGAR